ncbi:MAG: tetratricopeptide repeat protein [Proteobacteria bacterium]|nr:tetratricopeptide repeat protein [Pseudomonadota bacterium]
MESGQVESEAGPTPSADEPVVVPEIGIAEGEPPAAAESVFLVLDEILQPARLTKAVAEETAESIKLPAAASDREILTFNLSEEPEEKSVVGVVACASPAAAAPDVPTIRLTLEAYASRMNSMEDRHRTLLAQAIADQDDGQRDRLQRELVIMNDKLALITDSYAAEVACYQQVLNILEQLRQGSGPQPVLDGAIAGLGDGNAGPAEACLAEWDGQPPAMADKIAFSRGQLAECRVDLQQALIQYRQAVALSPDDPHCLHAAGRLARMLYNYKESIPWLRSLVGLARRNSTDDPLALAFAQRELAYTYVLAGQHRKAGPLYKESMVAMAKKLGRDHHELGICWFQIGEFQEMSGEYEKAISLYKDALVIVEKQKGVEHPALVAILVRLAALCAELEMEKEAVPLYERLVRIQEKVLRPNHLQLANSLNSLGESYRLVGRYEDAESCYQKILTIHEATYGPDHPGVAAVLQELAKLNSNLRRPEEARQYKERATAIFQKSVEMQKNKGGDESLTLEL